MTINTEKCEFLCNRLAISGYVLTPEGLTTDPDKVAPITNYPPPENVKQLQRFLGMIGWYARFLPSISTDKFPLLGLLHKSEEWDWTNDHQIAFEKTFN